MCLIWWVWQVGRGQTSQVRVMVPSWLPALWGVANTLFVSISRVEWYRTCVLCTAMMVLKIERTSLMSRFAQKSTPFAQGTPHLEHILPADLDLVFGLKIFSKMRPIKSQLTGLCHAIYMESSWEWKKTERCKSRGIIPQKQCLIASWFWARILTIPLTLGLNSWCCLISIDSCCSCGTNWWFGRLMLEMLSNEVSKAIPIVWLFGYS